MGGGLYLLWEIQKGTKAVIDTNRTSHSSCRINYTLRHIYESVNEEEEREEDGEWARETLDFT